MNDSITPTPTTAPESTQAAPRAMSGEKAAWWAAFGILTFAVVAMLSLWN